MVQFPNAQPLQRPHQCTVARAVDRFTGGPRRRRFAEGVDPDARSLPRTHHLFSIRETAAANDITRNSCKGAIGDDSAIAGHDRLRDTGATGCGGERPGLSSPGSASSDGCVAGRRGSAHWIGTDPPPWTFPREPGFAESPASAQLFAWVFSACAVFFAIARCSSSVGSVCCANCLRLSSLPDLASFLNSATSSSWSFTIIVM